MNIHKAAEFCGLTIKGYRAAMRRGILPRPVRGTKRYDKVAIEKTLGRIANDDMLPDIAISAYDQWKAESNAGKAKWH